MMEEHAVIDLWRWKLLGMFLCFQAMYFLCCQEVWSCPSKRGRSLDLHRSFYDYSIVWQSGMDPKTYWNIVPKGFIHVALLQFPLVSPEFFPLQLFSSKAGVESARRQCDKLVSLRDLLENIQNGDASVGISDIARSLSASISSMALDYCGPIRLEKELGVKTTQKVGKDTLLLMLRSVGGLVSEAESLTLEERTAQRMQHSNTLCGRLSYLCSVDIATKEVVESLSRLEAATPSSLQSLLLSSHRPQLVPLLGQRSEVFNSSISAPDHRALDRMIERYRKALPCGRFGLFPALEVFHTDSTANGFIMPFGESLAVMTSEM